MVMLSYLGIAAGICGLDLLIKETVNTQIKENEKIYTCENKVIVTKYHNPGAALGALKENPCVLKGVTLFGLGSLVGGLSALSERKGFGLQKLGLSMMLGGAVSNAYERFRYGKVTDYIRFNFGNEKFRTIVYNMGDFAIFVGGFFVCIGEIICKEK